MSRKCKVLHILNAGDIGGVERLTLDLVAAQKSDPALEVALLFLQSWTGDLQTAFHDLGVPVYSLGLTSGRDLSPAKYRKAVSILRRFDVIHVHVFNVVLALAVRRAQVPAIFTVHGVLGHGRSMRLSDRINDRALRWFLNRHVNLVTYISQATKQEALERYGLKDVNSAVVYNGIAFRTGADPGAGVDGTTAAAIAGRFVVGTTTRFVEYKRVDRLIDGFALFARRNPQARLLLVGDGAMKAQLEAQVVRLGIRPQAIFAGFQPAVRPYQEAMSVCVFPAVAEPFGLVAVEALAIGKPVIVFADGGGIVEVVAPCAAADVVVDVPALAARLDYYATRPAELDAGAAARRDYARNFDIANTAVELRRHYLALKQGT